MGSPVLSVAKTLGAGLTIEICDVGANPIGGDAPYARLLKTGMARLTGFEPQPEALERLNALKSDRETYLSDAVGDGRDAELHIFHGSGFTSCFGADPGALRTVATLDTYMRELRTVPLPTRRLDDIVDVPSIDFLKIDVQGSELTIIQNGRAKLSSAVAIQTEVRFFPIYANEPVFGEVDAELRHQGFVLHDLVGLKRFKLNTPYARLLPRPSRRQLVDGDAIYIRDLRQVDDQSDAQLRKLAILGLTVFDSLDLGLFCLSHLVRRGAVDASLINHLLPE